MPMAMRAFVNNWRPSSVISICLGIGSECCQLNNSIIV
jgi:hypothetical protein